MKVGTRVVIPFAPWMDDVTAATAGYGYDLPDRRALIDATGVIEQVPGVPGGTFQVRLDNPARWPVNPIRVPAAVIRRRWPLNASRPEDGTDG